VIYSWFMSPEYKNWNALSRDIQAAVRQYLDDSALGNVESLTQRGFAFTLEKGITPSKIRTFCFSLGELSEGQRSDARKQNSPWHVVLPIQRGYLAHRGDTSNADIKLNERKGRRTKRPRDAWRTIKR